MCPDKKVDWFDKNLDWHLEDRIKARHIIQECWTEMYEILQTSRNADKRSDDGLPRKVIPITLSLLLLLILIFCSDSTPNGTRPTLTMKMVAQHKTRIQLKLTLIPLRFQRPKSEQLEVCSSTGKTAETLALD